MGVAPPLMLMATASGLALGSLVERRAVGWALASLPASRGRRQVPARQSAPRGALVRLACAALFATAAVSYGLSLEAVELEVLACCLVALSLTDALAFVIPNACVAPAALARLAYLASGVASGALGMSGLLLPLARATAVALLLITLELITERLTGSASLGGGDVKLLAVAALYLESGPLLAAVMLACLLGVAQGLVQRRRDAGSTFRPFPWGPAISLSLWLAVLAAAPLA